MDLQRRHIQLQGSSNLRDIGGYRTADGRQVRWGRVFRSGSLWGLTEADWRWMDAHGFALLCDLRSDAERELAPNIWRVDAPPRVVSKTYDGAGLFSRSGLTEASGVGAIEGMLYVQFARLLAPSLRGLFLALQQGDAPALVHCTAGQDRTGLAIALLLEALGVDRKTIHADYLLSTELRRPECEIDRASLADRASTNIVAAFYTDLLARTGEDAFRPKRLVDAAGQPLVDIALAAIASEWGSTAAYLERELGIGPEQLAGLRNYLTEPA